MTASRRRNCNVFFAALLPFLTVPLSAQDDGGYADYFAFAGEERSFFGQSVAGAGDVNQDGYADVIVGESRADSLGIDQAGSVYVYSGKDGTVLSHLLIADSDGVSVGADVFDRHADHRGICRA